MPRYSKRGLNGSATKSRKSFMKRDGPLAARSHTRFILRRYSLSLSLLHSFSTLSLSLSLCPTFPSSFFRSSLPRILANCFLFDPFSFRPSFPPLRDMPARTRAPETERISSHVPLEIHASSSSSLHPAVFLPLRMILRKIPCFLSFFPLFLKRSNVMGWGFCLSKELYLECSHVVTLIFKSF